MRDLKKIKELFAKNKFLLIVLLVGIGLLLIPTGNSKANDTSKTEMLEFSIENCERKIEKILSECAGVGRVKAAISVRGGSQNVYSMEESSNTRINKDETTKDTDKKISVLSAGSGSEEPIIIRQMYPEFLGATIVCDGADSSSVRRDISDAVYSLTGLSSDKITIIKMKN